MSFDLTTIREFFKCSNCPPCPWEKSKDVENGIRVTSSKPETQTTDGESEPSRYFPHNSVRSEPNWSHRPLPPTPPTTTTDAGVYKALWSFEARAEEELSFGKDDLFRVTERRGDWWKAERLVNGQVVASGVVPYNYLVKDEALEAQP